MANRDFRAVTKSGAVYERKDGNLFVKGRYFHNGEIRCVPSSFFDGMNSIPHELLHGQPLVDVPIIGQHIYALAFSEWRLSTPVVSVEEI
jgi:hypothetical protein